MTAVALNIEVEGATAAQVDAMADTIGASRLPPNRDVASVLSLAVEAAALLKTLLEIWKAARDLHTGAPGATVILRIRGQNKPVNVTDLAEPEVRALAERALQAQER
jgi:hypothetical protein